MEVKYKWLSVIKNFGNSSLIEIWKKDLLSLTGISQSIINKMDKNENVNTDVIVSICKDFNFDIVDISETIL